MLDVRTVVDGKRVAAATVLGDVIVGLSLQVPRARLRIVFSHGPRVRSLDVNGRSVGMLAVRRGKTELPRMELASIAEEEDDDANLEEGLETSKSR
jgi:hypothetical protein